MKKFFICSLVCFAFVSAKAQFVAGTKWKGTLHLDSPTDVILDFRTDTVEAISPDDNSSIELMKYTVQDTVLTLQKISGQSECDETVIGKYKMEMKDDGITLTVIDDTCEDRGPVLDDTKWIKE